MLVQCVQSIADPQPTIDLRIKHYACVAEIVYWLPSLIQFPKSSQRKYMQRDIIKVVHEDNKCDVQS